MRLRQGAVIGKGSIGFRHFSLLQELLPNGNHVHLGSREFDELLGSNLSGSDRPRELADSDFLIVASPATRHRDHVEAASLWGYPLLIEKPLTAALGDAQELADSVAVNKSLVQVAYVLRFSDGLKTVWEIMRRHAREDLHSITAVAHSYLPDWRPQKDFRAGVSAQTSLGGGVLLELSHELDYLLHLCGPLHIDYAKMSSSNELALEVETAVMVRGQTRSGADVSLSLDMANKKTQRGLMLQWKDGSSLAWDLLSNSLTGVQPSGIVEKRTLLDSKEEWFVRQFQSFQRSVEVQRQPTPSVKDGCSVLTLVENIRETSLRGQT